MSLALVNYDPDKHFSDTVDEDVVVHNMKLYLTPAPTSDITVKYFWSCIPVCNGSRARKTSELTAGDDYTLPKTVTARKGSTTANIPLTITGDSNPEPIESLRLYWGRVGVDGEDGSLPFRHPLQGAGEGERRDSLQPLGRVGSWRLPPQ